jgi:uncharacterized protein (TIGR00369 family)
VALAGYPPERHLLSDLGLEAEVTSGSTATVRLRATPELLGPDRGVRVGMLATLVDVVGGSAALRAIEPDWMATADLTVQMARPATGPLVESRATVLRKGRTTLVVEATVADLDGEGHTDPVGWATMTFAILPGRQTGPRVDMASSLPIRWSLDGAGLDGPVADVLGITVDDARRGIASLPVRDYVRNSFGAVQGGVMATLAEVAATAMVAAYDGVGTDAVVATDLHVGYLALGRVGPIVTRSRLLDHDPRSPERAVAVELFDQGAEDRATTVITVRLTSLEGTGAHRDR